MKLRNVALSLLFIIQLVHSAYAGQIESGTYRRDAFKLVLKKDHSFINTDTSLSVQRTGTYKINKNLLLLSGKEEVPHQKDTLEIVYKSENKLNFKKGNLFFRFVKGEEKNSILENITRGLLGLVALIIFAYLFSSDRKHINWGLVLKGTLLQIVLAILILKVPFIEGFFDFLSKAFVKVVDMAHHGATFIFGNFIDGSVHPYVKNFATWILPSVIFFSALSSLLYYWGVLQKIVIGMAWLMKRLMGLSGAESVSAAGNVFLGQTEAPLLVKPYLGKMTKSEILCLMAGGMATIAGGVLASYIGFLGGDSPEQKIYFAKHLLTASLMSAPAAIVFAKMILPEREKINTNLEVSKDKIGINALEAITNGTTDGLKLAVNVAAMLIVFISLVALANFMLDKVGLYTGLNGVIASFGHYSHLSFEAILGYTLAPISWLIGVPWEDSMIMGQLLGEKTILNEFVAYGNLGRLQHYMSDKSVLIATYALCGFANISSIGIQVGGIGALAPEQKSTLAKYGFKSLIAGTLACFSTAVIAGMLF